MYNKRYYSTSTTENNHEYNESGIRPTMKQNLERLLKLRPYPILDTDPTLNDSPYSTAKKIKYSANETADASYEISQNRDNTKNRDKSEIGSFQEYLKNVDQTNRTTVKNSDYVLLRLPPVSRQRKIFSMVIPKHHHVSANSTAKAGIANGHSPLRKDPADISDQKTRVNHKPMPVETKETPKAVKPVRVTSETLMAIKELDENAELNEDVNKRLKPKNMPVPNKNDGAHYKEQAKSPTKNGEKITLHEKHKVDGTEHNVNSWNIHSLNSSAVTMPENARKDFKPPVVKVLDENKKLDGLTDDYNKSAFNYLLSSAQKEKIISELHSALRPSLFPNMPPYIKFSSYGVRGESFPLPLQKLLKWKLSSITPIVVRRTIQNSGFKLVRSEHSMFNNPNDMSTDQSVQNPNSLQNHFGVTPHIVDAFCGAAPPPNELMMLPLSQSNDWVGTWGKHMKSMCFKTLREQQKLNHFPGTFQIGRKDRLWKNLQRLIMKYGQHEFGFIPTSYILPQDVRVLRQVWEKGNDEKWIVKPPASARGSGIRVISKWNQIPKKVPLVVQRYIDNPYLINDTKFDLRLYILITSVDPLQLYLYDNGLVRFASVKYSSDLNTISDRYMHLTNYSINRLSSQYTQNEDADACQGHKWTLRSLWTYMERERKVDVKKLWDGLADLVVKTFVSGESLISQMCRSNLNNRYNAYELFGIDVLYDEFLKPWILEVNISPSLHSSSPLDLAVKGPLVKDVMNIVGYHIPNKMSPDTHSTLLKMLGISSPLCYDKRLYTFNLSTKEREKQRFYTSVESREEYIDSILDELLPDDVRHLVTFEDELTQIGSFKKVFPTTTSYEYHQFFDGPRYYNRLFDAWECKYSEKREEGIAVLRKLCEQQVHLEVPDVCEEQSKTCDVPKNAQEEFEQMSDKSGGDKISDHR